MKKSDRWQSSMYDEAFANATIASRKFARIAELEADFLVTALGLAPGERLLDIPCGTGRHARVFAKHGVRVTGVDLNSGLVRMAKATPTKSRGTVRYAVGDMLDLKKYRAKFDVVVNLFTSFGYFSDERKNARVLREMVSALRPGGRLAIHLIDRDWLIPRFKPVSKSSLNGVLTTEARDYDPKTKRIESRTISLDLKSGKKREYYHQTRLYSKSEMVKLFKAVGLKRIQVFGDTDGSLYKKGESSHPIYIAWKSS